jgi:hypothetical protein
MAQMYVVTSFDYGGSSAVKLHVVTADLALAQEVYAAVLAVCDEHNATCDAAARLLVELTHVPQDAKLLGADARTLFWGDRCAQNNNYR